ncbi:hypothetical protein N7475_005757 [Penicillium sp. IBT 31633x]|nr:hypothetical protein N7475_005757 [Penicillium sp. IBT 31633x]
MFSGSRPAPSQQKKEQSTAANNNQNARTVGDESAMALLKMKQLELDRDSMAAEQDALDKKCKKMKAALDKLYARQDTLKVRMAHPGKDIAAAQSVIDQASRKRPESHFRSTQL